MKLIDRFKKFFGKKDNVNTDYYECGELIPIKAGTLVRIINAGSGAYGANGKPGVIVSGNPVYHSGLSLDTPGYFVHLDDGETWRIAINAKIEIIK